MKYCFDLHIHTIASGHAYSTLQESVTAAKEKGLKTIGISDHAPSMPGSSNIFHIHNLRVVPEFLDGIRVYKGVEANIINYEGGIDLYPSDMEHLDYVIASLHPPCINYADKKTNTRAVIGTMKNPYVNIIGHPDDGRYPLDYEELVKAAIDNHVLLELNNSSLSPMGFRCNGQINSKRMLEVCAKYNHSIILSSDAHIASSIGDFKNCDNLIKEVGFPEELIANTSIEKLKRYIAKM